MKKILIALDYNPTAQKVADDGYLFAKALRAEIILLHVVSDSLSYSLTGHITVMGFAGTKEPILKDKTKFDSPKKISQQFLENIKQKLDDNSILTLVQEGSYADIILKTAEDLLIDIIIMGSHSRNWTEKLLIGSVTEDVLRNTAIPVLIIPIRAV